MLRALQLTLLVAIALVVLPAPGAEAAPAAAPGRKPTPQLLEEAVARGEIDRPTADLHLAEVFAGRGASTKVPARFQSDAPWDGTLPLLRLRQRLASRPDSPTRARTVEALAVSTSCSSSSGSRPNETTSTHFYLAYGTIGSGLTAATYLTSLEASWSKQITSFGWAAPPAIASPAPIGTKYPVRTESFTSGLYGFVSTVGTGAGFVGDNPNTAWSDGDAYASCMVLNADFGPFPGTPQQALDATTAHELNHSIQYGYGVIGTSNDPDEALFEAGATWMEDEVFDGADDNYAYLWPDFGDSLGDYDASPYPMWLMLRGLLERFGTGVAGGGEQVMQDFWELTSRNVGNNLSTLAQAIAVRGVTLADAYHDFAIGAGFMKACGGGYVLPHCFEEAAGYVASAGGLPPVAGTIGAAGGSSPGTVEDDYSLAWITLPPGSYPVSLTNTSTGGQLRATAVCDTGTSLVRSPLPAVVGAGATTTLPVFDATSCVRRLAVVTNQQQSPGNPDNAARRGFTVSTGPPGAVAGLVPVTRASTAQYTLADSDGATWRMIDATKLAMTVEPSTAGTAVISANADLWTWTSGINQDLGIFVDNQLVAWKESGGSAGTFSPNAASVETVVSLSPGPHTIDLRWKTNKNAPGSKISAGAGPIGGQFSPTRLTALLVPSP